ncbi:MAG: WapI family immunity protein [Pirellulaceae bacterium]
MQLESSDGHSFSLNVVGYEFPDEELMPNEDNPADDFDRGRFLVVTVSVKTPDGDWNATAPEMTTTQFERLANWLESVSSGHPSITGFYFTERDLEFTLDDEAGVLNVHLIRDFLPPWTKLDVYTIAFPICRTNLVQAVSSIRSQLIRSPHRPLPNQSA